MGNGKCQFDFGKTQRSPLFLTKTARKTFWQKRSQHTAKLNGAPSINAKTLAFPSFLLSEDSKIYLLHSKNSEILFFIANKSPKKFRSPKIGNMIDPEPVVVFI